jgi:hypothetical protein
VDHQYGRYARLRYTATGAVAALVAVGAIAGTVALAAKPHVNAHGHAAVAKGGPTETPAGPGPGKAHASRPGSSQPFLAAVQRLVGDGTLTMTQGQVVDREIQAGRVDTQTLASSGFTDVQLQAVQQALSSTKRALASTAPRTSK